MSKYLVKKDFIDNGGHLWSTGDTLDMSASGGWISHKDSLVQFGFIEEVKENSRWRANDYGSYYIVNPVGSRIELNKAFETNQNNESVDTNRHENGNYFRTPETAKKVADALKLFFEYLHTVPGTPQQNIKNQFEHAHAEARNTVLADDKRGSDD